MKHVSWQTILIASVLLFGFTACANKAPIRPWQESFGTTVEFGFEDLDPDPGELQGGIVLRGVQSPTHFDQYQVFWARSAKAEGKGKLLGERSFVNFTSNPLITLAPNSPVQGDYMLLFIKNADQTQFTGKFIKVRDFVKQTTDASGDLGSPVSPEKRASNEFDPEATKVLFGFDQSRLSQKFRDNLDQLFQSHPDLTTQKLVVVGHGDERGSNAYNLALGQRRAQAVKDYLVRIVGIKGQLIQAYSCGEEQPLNPGSSESAWQENRRAVTLHLKEQAYDCASKAQY